MLPPFSVWQILEHVVCSAETNTDTNHLVPSQSNHSSYVNLGSVNSTSLVKQKSDSPTRLNKYGT